MTPKERAETEIYFLAILQKIYLLKYKISEFEIEYKIREERKTITEKEVLDSYIFNNYNKIFYNIMCGKFQTDLSNYQEEKL
jgi:hypothetical protein